MPKRNNYRRFEGCKTQGEDSYVIFRRFTWGEEREFRKQVKALGDEGREAVADITLQAVVDHIHAWNWVDDDGNPMPKPATVEDCDKFNTNELMFLNECFQELFAGMSEDEKKV